MNVETRYRWASYVGLLACVASRAPTLMEDGKAFDLPLNFNVGYVVLFGSLALFLFYVDAWRSISRAPDIADVSTDIGLKALVIFPAICAAFLSLQFFTEMRPIHASCDDHWAWLNWRLMGESVQTKYCIGDEISQGMPYVMWPVGLFMAIQVVAPILSFAIAIATIRLLERRMREHEIGKQQTV